MIVLLTLSDVVNKPEHRSFTSYLFQPHFQGCKGVAGTLLTQPPRHSGVLRGGDSLGSALS